jgi:hypothetical protein
MAMPVNTKINKIRRICDLLALRQYIQPAYDQEITDIAALRESGASNEGWAQKTIYGDMELRDLDSDIKYCEILVELGVPPETSIRQVPRLRIGWDNAARIHHLLTRRWDYDCDENPRQVWGHND